MIDLATNALTYGVGSGIVWDSDPASEWLETEHKLEGLRAALREAAA